MSSSNKDLRKPSKSKSLIGLTVADAQANLTFAPCAKCGETTTSVQFSEDFDLWLCSNCLETTEQSYAASEEEERRINDAIDERCRKEGK